MLDLELHKNNVHYNEHIHLLVAHNVPYSGKLSREKTFANYSLVPPRNAMPANFVEKFSNRH